MLANIMMKMSIITYALIFKSNTEEVNEHNKSSTKIIIFQDAPKSLIHINIKINLPVPHSNKNYLYLRHIQKCKVPESKSVYTLC